MASFTEERNRLAVALKKAQHDATEKERAALQKLDQDFEALKGLYAFYKGLEVFESRKAFLTSCPSKVQWESVSYYDNDYYNPGSTWNGFVADHRFQPPSKSANDRNIKDFGPEGYENYRTTVAELIFRPLAKPVHADDQGDRDSINKTMAREGLSVDMAAFYQSHAKEAERLSFAEIEAYIAEQSTKRGEGGLIAPIQTAGGLKTACAEMLKVWMTPPPAPPKPPVTTCKASWPMGFRKR